MNFYNYKSKEIYNEIKNVFDTWKLDEKDLILLYNHRCYSLKIFNVLNLMDYDLIGNSILIKNTLKELNERLLKTKKITKRGIVKWSRGERKLV